MLGPADLSVADNRVRTKIEQFADDLADLLDEGANVFPNGIREPGAPPTTSDWAVDQKVWLSKFGSSDEVAGWVSETTGIYLAESGQLLLAYAALLRSRRVFVSVDLVTRAIIERVGHVNWILDARIDAEARAARAGLEFAACLFMYRESLSDLDADRDIRNKLKAEAKAHQANLKKWFSVYQPPHDKCDEKSPQTGDVTRWTVNGESFPSLTTATHFALESAGIKPETSKGTYGGLSGFSHPNVAFSRERRDIGPDAKITFRQEPEEMEKCARMALLRFAVSVKNWVNYYQAEQDRVITKLDEIGYRLEILCGTTPSE